jgi:hypothetical protein
MHCELTAYERILDKARFMRANVNQVLKDIYGFDSFRPANAGMGECTQGEGMARLGDFVSHTLNEPQLVV